jgi:mono/diheme cytochrome c family protein
MKLRSTILLVPVACLLTACSFTLAADITPPPDYVSPTPMPTLGALHPTSAPDAQNGAAIFAQNCAPCHGPKGLGDGPQSMQLPVTVPGIGLPEVARSASPAAWFKVVTQGNLDRFMPPFAGALSDQQRWDVIAYALTLHTTPQEIAHGKSLVDANCADCPSKFLDQVKMAAVSEDDLTAIIKNGGDGIPAFGKSYTDDEAQAAAEYLRTLTFAVEPQVAAASTLSGPVIPTVTTAGATPASSAQATPSAGVGTVSGRIEAPAAVQANPLTVTLHGFDHAADQTSGPQEVLTLSTTAGADGSYTFENVAMPLNRIFLAEVTYEGIPYRSDFEAATANATQVSLPLVKLYETSTDVSLLRLDQLHIVTDFATAGTVEVREIYGFTNPSKNAVVISPDGKTVPFIRFPQGARNTGFEAGQDSPPFQKSDAGVVAVPSDKPYSIIALFSLPYDKQVEFNQSLGIDTPSTILLVPEGINVKSKQLTDNGLQSMNNNSFQEFVAHDLKSGETLSFSMSGQPRTSPAAILGAHPQLLIGGGILGLALLGGGFFLYLRDRKRGQPKSPEAEFESADAVMDSILALDDLHRAGKISDAAYETRRAELKKSLRELA